MSDLNPKGSALLLERTKGSMRCTEPKCTRSGRYRMRMAGSYVKADSLVHRYAQVCKPCAQAQREGERELPGLLAGMADQVKEAKARTAGLSSDLLGEGTAGSTTVPGTLDRPGPHVSSGDSTGAPPVAVEPGGEGSAAGAPQKSTESPVAVEPPARLFDDSPPPSAYDPYSEAA